MNATKYTVELHSPGYTPGSVSGNVANFDSFKEACEIFGSISDTLLEGETLYLYVDKGFELDVFLKIERKGGVIVNAAR